MKGIVSKKCSYFYGYGFFGFIKGDDEKCYFFKSKSCSEAYHINIGTCVIFDVLEVQEEGKRDIAVNIKIDDSNNEEATGQGKIIRYYKPGLSRHLDLESIAKKHLEPGTGEYEVLKKLKNILYITYINHHDMGMNKNYPYCLVGVTEYLKQYIHTHSEFLLIFSHFKSESWEQTTLMQAKNIRQRRDVSNRRPLVNFFIVVSNAKDLIPQINSMKGGIESAIIPFSFDEILKTNGKEELIALLLSRFDEYLFENNMLGEKNPIEEDTLLFGDRGKIADSIVERCVQKKHSGIFGLRRSGKSSVLRAVERRLENHNIKYVTIESRSEIENTDWKYALYHIARKVKIAVSEIVQDKDETKEKFDARLCLNSTYKDYEYSPTNQFVEDIKLYVKGEKCFVISVDEVELITYNTATSDQWKSLNSYKAFWGALRDCGCSLIICGVNSTINEINTIKYNLETCDNPMFERIHSVVGASKTYLPAFTDEQTKIMINTLGGYSNISFSEVYVDINRAFGGQPYPIRQFCSYVFENVKTHRKHNEIYKVTQPTVKALLNRFNDSREGIDLYKTILQHILIYKDEYRVLVKLAFNPKEYQNLAAKDINKIDHLMKYGIISYDNNTGYVTFCIQSLQSYIIKIESQDVIDMDDAQRRRYVQDSVDFVEKKLKQYILNYYTFKGEQDGIQMFIQAEQNTHISFHKQAGVNISSCGLTDFFDTSKFLFYFSTIKELIVNNWNTLGLVIKNKGMSKNLFESSMNNMNECRKIADHTSASSMNDEDNMRIDDDSILRFKSSYNDLNKIIKKLNI